MAEQVEYKWPATSWQARCYNDQNSEVLRLYPGSIQSGLYGLTYEIVKLGNPEKIVRCDLYDLLGFAVRINVNARGAVAQDHHRPQ